MNKILLTLVLTLLIFPVVLAVDLTIEKQSENEVMIFDLNQPASFDLLVTNNGHKDDFFFYTFFGLGLEPAERISFTKGETKEVTLKVYPRDDLKTRGYVIFDYFVQGRDSSEVQERLTLNIINLEDAFEIGTAELNPESNSIQISFENIVNFNFENVNVKFDSAFFHFEEEFPLTSYGEKELNIELDKEDFKKLMAGFYTMTAELTVENQTKIIEKKIKFAEKDILTTTKKDSGFIISTKIISKVNEGNVVANTQTVLKKNIISRLFTSFTPEPALVDRKGLTVYYTWNEEIAPGESSEIGVKTNWFIPFLIIILIVVIVILSKKVKNTDVVIRKKVSFVKAKGGEFALKVSVIVDAKNYVEKLKVVDKLPPLVKVFNRFGGEEPTKFDRERKKIEWDFDRLDAGEKRIMTYIIYSKVGVLGRFALPPTTALFEREGKMKEVNSNRAFFTAQTRDRYQ